MNPNQPATNHTQSQSLEAQGADRWKQVQELLLGEHQRSTDARLTEVGNRLGQEGERLTELILTLERKNVALQEELGKEVSNREALQAEVQALRSSHVSRADFAASLQDLAKKLHPGGA